MSVLVVAILGERRGGKMGGVSSSLSYLNTTFFELSLSFGGVADFTGGGGRGGGGDSDLLERVGGRDGGE